MRSNITLMKWMIAEGYADARTLKRRIKSMEEWIANGTLLKADANAQYAAVIEIDLAEVTGAKIDEVFIGSCMTNIGHFRAAAKVLEGKSDIPNRLGIDTQVYLGSAELAAMCALAGCIVTVPEYMEQIKLVKSIAT